MTQHLTREQLIGYIYGMLTDIEREDVDQHLSECAMCRAGLTEQETVYRQIHYSVLKLRQLRLPESTSFSAVEHRLHRSKRMTRLWSVSGQIMAAAGFVLVFGLIALGLINVFGGSSQPVTTAITQGTTFRGNPQRTGQYDVMLAPRHGELAWTFETGDDIWTSPAMFGDTVYINSNDKTLYALDAATGQQKWAFAQEYSAFSSPAIANGIVYVGDGLYLYALNADTGQELWEFKASAAIESTPAVVNDVVYVGSNDSHLYAVDAETGVLKWKFKTGRFVFSSPAIADGVVYVGSDDYHLYALEAETGELKWKFETGLYVKSSPAVAGGMVYFGSFDQYLYAIDSRTGKLVWKYKTGAGVKSSPLIDEGIVYFGSEDGTLYAVR